MPCIFTVISTARTMAACIFHGQVDVGNPGHLHFPRSCQRRGPSSWGRQEGVWGNLEPGPWSSGGGGGSGFPQGFSNDLPPSVCAEWSCSDPDLTLGAPRGGGEVGITEAERSDPVLPGRRGYRAGIAVHSARMRLHGTVEPVCGVCR